MTFITKNFGLTKAIFVSPTAPSNIKVLWYNTNDNLHYYYNTLSTTWQLLITNGRSLPIVRYIYLVSDLSDVVRMGSVDGHAYTTIQTAYDAAITLSANTHYICILIGVTDASTVGNLVLSTNNNGFVSFKGISSQVSNLGSITAPGFSLDIIADNVNIASIDTSSHTGDGNYTNVSGNDLIIGTIDTSSYHANGNAGDVIINKCNYAAGGITANGTGSGNGGNLIITNSNIYGDMTTSGGTTGDAGTINLTNNVRVTGTINQIKNGKSTNPTTSITQNCYINALIQTNNSSNSFGSFTMTDSVLTYLTKIKTSTGGFGAISYTNCSSDIGIATLVDCVITGLTTLDPSTVPDISQGLLYRYIFVRSSNSTESITNISSSNWPENYPVRIQPNAGLTLTFVHATSSINKPRCAGGVNVVLNGSNGDWVEFTKLNGIIYQTSGETY